MKGGALVLGAVAALALASRPRGSAARRPPLDYDALADDFRAFYAQLGWAVDEEQELRRWARSHHVTYLGAGAQRAVFGVLGGALKIAFSRGNGFAANRHEAEVWEDAPADIRRYLVPVLKHSGTEPGKGAWVLMERVQCSAHGNMPHEVQARFKTCGINDIVGQNLSDDGRLLDYGWMDMVRWSDCATPGTPTSNRPAVGGSAARQLAKRVRVCSRAQVDAAYLAWRDRSGLGDAAVFRMDDRVILFADFFLEVGGNTSWDWLFSCRRAGNLPGRINAGEKKDLDRLHRGIRATAAYFNALDFPLPVYRGLQMWGEDRSVRTQDAGSYWTPNLAVARRFADGTHWSASDSGDVPGTQRARGPTPAILQGVVQDAAHVDWPQTLMNYLQFSLEDDVDVESQVVSHQVHSVSVHPQVPVSSWTRR